ncbi:MAG: hypothetical protein PUD50_11740, partial [Eubacteriales bacterium]|nr:hypothetical protein [Eubacteriales bacterium]
TFHCEPNINLLDKLVMNAKSNKLGAIQTFVGILFGNLQVMCLLRTHLNPPVSRPKSSRILTNKIPPVLRDDWRDGNLRRPASLAAAKPGGSEWWCAPHA